MEQSSQNHQAKGKPFQRYVLSGILAAFIVSILWLGLKSDSSSSSSSGVSASAQDTREQGLHVRFEDVGSQKSDSRISRLLALRVEPGESPTPFLQPGPFQATWQGWIEIPEDDDYIFSFEGNGRAEMTIGNAAALQAGESTGDSVSLSAGFHPLSVSYHSPEDEAARMRLLWSTSSFIPEPIPPTALSHDGSDEGLRQAARLRQGRELMAEQMCVNCHEPEDPSFLEASLAMPELAMQGPDLTDVGSRLHGAWMQQWIKDPQSVRPSATMPNMNFNDQQAADIASYLSTLGDAPPVHRPASADRIKEGGQIYAMQGCVGCHTLESHDEDGGRLSLAGVAGKWHPAALEDYLMDPSKDHEWTRMPDFRLSEQEAGSIAAFLMDRSDASGSGEPVDGDPGRGRALIAEHGCVSCHNAPVENQLQSPSLEALVQADWEQGFTGAQISETTTPHPDLTIEEREALMAFAQEGLESLNRRSPIEFASRQIISLNCQACHQIDGQGDLWSDHEDEVEHLLEGAEENHHDFAQRRPLITWAGEKLQPEWLEKVIAGQLEFSARPWMIPRMPAFRAQSSLLSEGLLASHGIDKEFEHVQTDPDLVSEGRSFARGLGRGFYCQSCHHGGAGGGFPAPDLTLIGERLQPDFFQWMLHSPRRVDPQTAMPEFADAKGKTRHLDRFEGDSRKQFEAIWHYLVDNRAGREFEPGEEQADTGTPWGELYQQMQKGPIYSGVIDVPDYDPEDLEINPVLGYITNVPTDGHKPKGLAIRLGDRQQASMHYDHDLLTMTAAWTGNFLEFRNNHDLGARNVPPPAVAGDIHFTTSDVAGWINQTEKDFTDPRNPAIGPMPKEQGYYEGVYLHGDHVVLSYNIHGTSVYESPWFVEDDNTGAFIRDFKIAENDQSLSVLLFESEGDVKIDRQGSMQVARSEHDGRVSIATISVDDNVELYSADRKAALRISPKSEQRSIRVLLWEGEVDDQEEFLSLANNNASPQDLDRLTTPGPARWGEPLLTKGVPGENDGVYTVDDLNVPVENPFNALMHFTGIDFMPDGRAVLTTMHGDVWLVDGLDESLEEISWQRYATGLNRPFGVRVVDDKVYVSNEDELTILHDRDGNGEADYFENFTNLIAPGGGAWRQAFGLEIDDEGNFYFARGRGARESDMREGIFQISPDGQQIERIASGFRQPWGMGISPEGHISVSQQEGPWVPQTPVHMVDVENRKGSFYGHQPGQFREEDPYPREAGYEPPIVWLPRNIDNSGAGQVWIESDNWGLPSGQMLHLSYGQGSVMQLMYEQVEGDYQGGVVPLIQFEDAKPRAGRFRPQDGQLYVVGLHSGGFERVRYTGKNVNLPVAIHIHDNGIRIRFSNPLNPEMAADPDSYTVHRWNYLWSSDYGSGKYSVKNPELFGEDPVDVASVTIMDDDHEIFLEIPDMVPAMQMRISYDLQAADGTELREEIHNTVNVLGTTFDP